MNSKERKEKIKPEAVFMIGGKLYQILKVEDSNAVRNLRHWQMSTKGYGVSQMLRSMKPGE